MRRKTVWVADYFEPYEGGTVYGVFTTARAAMKAVNEHHSFNRRIWPRAKPWVEYGSGCWERKDGYRVSPYVLGEWE